MNEPPGGVDSPYVFPPQHATVPSVRSPHVWPLPELTEVNEPEGGVDLLSRLLPQQTTAPSIRTPQT